MGIETVYTCDCCGATLPSSSVLDCSILTAMVPNSQVTQVFFGIACGCADGIRAAITASEAKHQTMHKPPAAPATPTSPATTPAAAPGLAVAQTKTVSRG